MSLDAVTVCSGGLRIAQRDTPAPATGAELRVGAVAAVATPDGAPVEAHRADGALWRRHWPEPTRLVIEFVDAVTVEVDHARGLVTFDRPLPADTEQHLLFDHVLPLVLAHRGALVVHGAVISREGRGAVLVGSSGVGKSTLAAFAWQRGWTMGGDDGAVLLPTRPPTVEPTYATVRLTPAGAGLLGIATRALPAVVGKLRLSGDGASAFRREAVDLTLVAILDPAPAGEPARFDRLGGIDAHAELFGSTFHAELSGTRLLPAVVDDLATIVETTTVGRLHVPRGREGLVAAERMLRRRLEDTP